MTRWKAAGAAPRDIDDALWAEFRGIQDDFFNARSSVLSEQDAEFKTNLEAKLALLDEAEATHPSGERPEHGQGRLPHLPGEVQRLRPRPARADAYPRLPA